MKLQVIGPFDNLKNENDLKKDGLKHKDDLKNEEDLRNEDDHARAKTILIERNYTIVCINYEEYS